MATYLTTTALCHLQNSEYLKGKIAAFCGLKISGVDSAIIRHSSSLTTYLAVKFISESMGVEPETILEQLP